MRRIITICSLVLALAVIVTAFTACGDKTGDETTTTTTTVAGEVQNQIPAGYDGFTVEIGDTEAIVKKDGEEFQILKYPSNPNIVFDKAYATEHSEFLDMNFDGLPDFYVAVSSVGGEISYYCWLYNGTTNKFDYSIILSALKNISVDAENHRILSTIKNGDSTSVVSYHWVDGDLVLEKKFDNAADEEITKVVEDNAIGSNKPSTTVSSDNKDTTKNPDKKPNNDSKDENKTTTKVNKPNYTTTTQPYTGGVQLATGDIDDGWNVGWY